MVRVTGRIPIRDTNTAVTTAQPPIKKQPSGEQRCNQHQQRIPAPVKQPTQAATRSCIILECAIHGCMGSSIVKLLSSIFLLFLSRVLSRNRQTPGIQRVLRLKIFLHPLDVDDGAHLGELYIQLHGRCRGMQHIGLRRRTLGNPSQNLTPACHFGVAFLV